MDRAKINHYCRRSIELIIQKQTSKLTKSSTDSNSKRYSRQSRSLSFRTYLCKFQESTKFPSHADMLKLEGQSQNRPT